MTNFSAVIKSKLMYMYVKVQTMHISIEKYFCFRQTRLKTQ